MLNIQPYYTVDLIITPYLNDEKVLKYMNQKYTDVYVMLV